MSQQFAIIHLVEAFCVSKSGYYHWLYREKTPSLREQQNKELTTTITQIHQESRSTYGVPRVQASLKAQGQSHGKNRIQRLMKEAGLYGRKPRRYIPKTTQSNHQGIIAANLLKNKEVPQQINSQWVSDITYIGTLEGWLYLSAVMDRSSRRIIGWSFSKSMESDLVEKALKMAIKQREVKKGLIVHSDRGSQYSSKSYRKILEEKGVKPSMSRRANCYDNAAMESFWSTLKIECVYANQYESREEAQRSIFQYIEGYYNVKRMHSSLNYQSPVNFELQQSNQLN